ncbi:hypothetical protein DJ533_15710 [Acinetobacter defluvii]|uniref:DUF4149 domain-containing protein n=1 Tax=Acinetobacter defluvii TaxID=1871111 RepID=A0A2S2FG81_9GAMM|nr:hypothetical protein [Acinetobacter defluvii]AWL29910.1 hypothetical protein DJ533_15710 [Acinetobacter defluvii]
MKHFFLNFTKILETNPKIYWSVIVAIAGCLTLYFAEIIHVQNLYPTIQSNDPRVVKGIIDPIVQRYHWARIVVVIAALILANLQYIKTKKSLNL